jgi:hypothetical protein
MKGDKQMIKCPKCEKDIAHLNLEEIPIHTKGKTAWKGIPFNCPQCLSPLSVQIDPVALDADLLKAIKLHLLSMPK